MEDIKSRVEAMIAQLRLERDKLRVKLSLAKLETREEWQRLERKMAELEAKAKELGGATSEAAHDIGAAAKLLGEEIRDGLRDIRRHL